MAIPIEQQIEQGTYQDISTESWVQYDEHGWTGQQVWMLDTKAVDASDPDTTLTDAQQSNPIPSRGDNHPSGEDMQADVIRTQALSSTQVKITVTYRKLSAVDNEPDLKQPGLMTIGSSVKNQITTTDANGNPLTVYYIASSGSALWNIYPSLLAPTPSASPPTELTPPLITNPSNSATGEVQVPCTIIRFSRREPTLPAATIQTYETAVNSAAINWQGFKAAKGTMLCTRIEANTQDNGISYIVEYEFQYLSQYNTKTSTENGWKLGSIYVLPNGTTGLLAAGGTATIGPGDSPTDAIPLYFQIYKSQDFNALQLA